MKVLGFTGTRQTADHEEELESYLIHCMTGTWLPSFDRYVTGGCRGWDAFVGRYLAVAFPDTPQTVYVPWNKSQVDPWWEDAEFQEQVDNGLITVVYMPEGTDYRSRNEKIVDEATEVFYCADYPEAHPKSRRSGTWMTKRIAEANDVPVNGIILNKE